MKKIYMLATAFLICINLSAQTFYSTATFEDVTLNSIDTFDNGSAGNGAFYSDLIVFSNFYDDAWGSWSGFSISNMTDNTTPGWENQYSAYTGSGFNSTNYAVYYPSGSIFSTISDTDLIFDSLKLTNTAYAAISMRDGDAFAKQFGSIYAADGLTLDGTNGEDFFRVWVIGSEYTGGQKDSVEVYLADYRFSDNTQDYILDAWLNVDLSNFSFPVRSIEFRLASSDNGTFGMNTPSYFAIDNVDFHWSGVGISEPELSMNVYPNPFNEELVVKGENGWLELRDLNGKLVRSQELIGTTLIETADLPNGLYFLQLTNDRGTALQKVIK
jgi:hypothetical protein